ncbi:hypothetical protein [Deinococcus ficus]|uniref:Uncharacterized protein n=1 Tax=Deinococcus ficus TaxID=317577 RepID=A0A221T2X7_9DEIO|nr:hypothetical protein [Deinococcus ficus]ASN83277.1 hypothetical protein DFI_18945 [Deinococcus ficus]
MLDITRFPFALIGTTAQGEAMYSGESRDDALALTLVVQHSGTYALTATTLDTYHMHTVQATAATPQQALDDAFNRLCEPDTSRDGFHYRGAGENNTAIYAKGFDESLTGYLHVHQDGTFGLYLASTDSEGQTSEAPHYGFGQTPEQAIEHAFSSFNGLFEQLDFTTSFPVREVDDLL